MTVTDDDTGVATTMLEYVVVYDPNGGFVTGGGWVHSPAGAYVADSTLTGKASFGFVSKYQKGTTIPAGETEFQFHAAGFSFQSTIYEWLVVSGSLAQYKGSGTIKLQQGMKQTAHGSFPCAVLAFFLRESQQARIWCILRISQRAVVSSLRHGCRVGTFPRAGAAPFVEGEARHLLAEIIG